MHGETVAVRCRSSAWSCRRRRAVADD